MDTIGKRIKYIRENVESSKISMSAFGTRLGVTSGAISQWENEQKSPSHSIVLAICREFNINETWLLTGEGDMKAPATREAEIASITAALYTEPEDSFRSKFIKLAAQMTDEQLKIVEEMVNALASKH